MFRLFVITLTVVAVVAVSAGRATAAVTPPSVVVDTDMDLDDTAALAYLGELDKLGRIDLRSPSSVAANPRRRPRSSG